MTSRWKVTEIWLFSTEKSPETWKVEKNVSFILLLSAYFCLFDDFLLQAKGYDGKQTTLKRLNAYFGLVKLEFGNQFCDVLCITYEKSSKFSA